MQKLVSDNSQNMQLLHATISKKLFFYMQVKGMSRVEAINRILAKIIKHKGSPSQGTSSSMGVGDPETYAKIRKQSGLGHEDVIKTM